MSTRYEYYNTGNDAYDALYGAHWSAQTFTPSTAHKITSVKLMFYRNSGSPGTVTVSVRATDASEHPTGSDLCSGTTDGNAFTTDTAGTWYEITLGTGYDLSASTKYAIVVRVISGDTANWVAWLADATSATYTGGCREASTDSGGTWTSNTNRDLMFEDWGAVLPTTVTNLATNIDSANSYLSGILTADGGEACTCGFQWGLTNAYGSTTSTVSLTTGQGFSLLISGLTANTTYHFRAFATNSAGTSYGSDVSFVSGVSSNSGYIWVETDDNRFHFMDAAGTEQINIAQSDFDATTFLYATSDNTPQAKTPAQVMAILSAQAAALFSFNSQAVTAVSEITLVPKASSTGAEGTMFYCSDDDSVYVGTE